MIIKTLGFNINQVLTATKDYYKFNFEEELPTQDQFNQQIRQDVLTSTDETESLVSRLNKINTAALNDFVIGCDVTSQNEP